jgi:site-specific recombinase XerD
VTTTLTTTGGGAMISQEAQDAAFADFLRLKVGYGVASPKTLANYKAQVGAFATWCAGCNVSPGMAIEGAVEAYRRYMIDAGFARATIGVKLQAIKRFFDAATWRGLRAPSFLLAGK